MAVIEEDGPLLTVLDRFVAGAATSRVASASSVLSERVASTPARVLGLVLSLGFAASFLATLATGELTLPVYVFHALGLLVGVAALRDHRDAAALAESPVWGAVVAVFTPPPEPDDR